MPDMVLTRRILADRDARQQLLAILQTEAPTGTIVYRGKVYTVLVGPAKVVIL